MPVWDERANEIFFAATEIVDERAREDFLRDQCGRDVDLRQRVDSLLADNVDAARFLKASERALEEIQSTAIGAKRLALPKGTLIDRYKVLDRIGEGGFGAVYLAEQLKPVRRNVALKVIKPGMDSQEVIARFEAERQALALMNHPNIARVLDAGTTDGRPYFVMEFVRGTKITEFCDKKNLSLRERLELLMSVCSAVQHAHQKGVIHRDLKPSNVLVTMDGATPSAKVIDFGVAKAISQKLTEKTLFTRLGQVVGTPQYMSPEQADVDANDIDTRSDVYSLGVLLYELVTGHTPISPDILLSAGWKEMQRVVREEEPPRPSDKLSTVEDELPLIAKKRQEKPQTLRASLRGELDWIVMKAIEKDRERRYETPSRLAQDIQRHLNNEAVEASPPSFVYRFRKLARKHRTILAIGGAAAISLLLGMITTTWMAHVARHHRAVADQRLEDIRGGVQERAFLFAINGDQERALPTIQDAQTAGAPESWAEKMKSILYYVNLKGDGQPHAQRAAALGDNSLAVKALLAKKIIYQSRSWYRTTVEDRVITREADPRSFEDELFLAVLNWDRNPPLALEMINRSIKNYPSVAALRIRALAQEHTAYQTGDLALLHDAIKDADAAQRLTGELSVIPLILRSSLATLEELAGRSEIADHYRAESAEVAAEMLEHLDQLRAAEARHLGHYFQDIGDLVTLKRIVDYVSSINKGRERAKARGYLAFHYWARGEFQQAHEYIPSNWFLLPRALILADDAEQRSAFRLELLELAKDKDVAPIDPVATLHLIGFGDDGRRLAQVFVDEQSKTGAVAPYLEFFAGSVSPDELLLQSGGSERDKRSAHWMIAHWYFGHHNREEARRHLKLVSEPRRWATGILERMDGDPNWPPWLE